jgi:2-polyprenyl-3-methyl-5-hydroxy-6-metoxy-1,4-benzoquinol methylase
MNHVVSNNHCLACGSSNIKTALDLGMQPLANAYKNFADESESQYPLAVALCHDCYHLQLTHSVDPAIIYRNYLYATGTNQTIQDYSDWFAAWCQEYSGYPSTVLDIGCNDGTQLNYFKKFGIKTYGIDPAENLHKLSSVNHDVVCDFFGPSAVEKLKDVKYDIIIAQNVCAHNPNPLNFIKSCNELMSNDTLLFIQTSQADMVLNNEFDTIYHEHINFFNANSMAKLAKQAGLYLIDVIKTPIHGNSYIFVLSCNNQRPYHVTNIVDMEARAGLMSVSKYQDWERTVHLNVNDLIQTVTAFRNDGYTIVGYGAAAKGNTLLNFSKIKLDFIIDDSPLKQGKFTPGTSCPIVSINELQKYSNTDKILFVPLAWNFFAEIKNRIQSVRSNSIDRFIQYFPKVKIHE